VLIHEKIYPQIIEKMVEEIKKIKIGNGFDSTNKLGPLISEGTLI
jgi:betaine-aldehyde dehydrogenase